MDATMAKMLPKRAEMEPESAKMEPERAQTELKRAKIEVRRGKKAAKRAACRPGEPRWTPGWATVDAKRANFPKSEQKQ